MKVILLEKIRNLGELGAQVEVRPGYGRNYLLPQGKAIVANNSNIKFFEERKKELEAKSAQQLAAAQQRAKSLDNLELIIQARVSEDNRLYGSIGIHEIVEAVKAKGLTVTRQEVQLPNGPFRAIGDYEVKLFLLNDEVSANIKLSVVPVRE